MKRTDNNTDDNNTLILNNTVVQQYKNLSQSSSNISSNMMLQQVWQTSNKLFNKKSGHIISSAKEDLKDSNYCNNMQYWNTSFSQLPDPILLLEKSLSRCNKCIEQKYLTLSECNCSNDDPSKEHSDAIYFRPLTAKTCSQEGRIGEDSRLLKPKFGPSRSKKIIPPSKVVSATHVTIESNFDGEKPSTSTDVDMIDEEKAHKSEVAKITFKLAKETLLASNPAARRTLGASRKAQAKFVSPMLGVQEKQEVIEPAMTDERLKHIDPKMIELIESEIIDKGAPVGWDDIAGLEQAKNVIQEAVVWPLLRPDIFTGLRRPPRGVLLFGPPGTGKTLIGKCVSAQCRATFFSISASSLTSKWIGDGEKMVRALFAVARCHQPAVIFIDEIDSLLTQRSDTEHEASRRIKTEFLVQFDGAATSDEDRILIVGATNRPQELDEAARRRLVKRLYIPLPDFEARKRIISNLLKNEQHSLTEAQTADVARLAGGYSGADVRSLCSEAAMGPVRAVPLAMITSIHRDKVRPVNIQDFKTALQRVRPSVSQDDLEQYVKWNNTYGHGF